MPCTVAYDTNTLHWAYVIILSLEGLNSNHLAKNRSLGIEEERSKWVFCHLFLLARGGFLNLNI